MKRIRTKQGSALLIAILAIMILSGLALLMVNRGQFGIRDTVAFRNVQSAFTAAEAGVDQARLNLNNGGSNTWDDELALVAGADPNVTTDDAPFITLTTIAWDKSGNPKQSYSVMIQDNSDLDPSLVVDADNRIWIISTGCSGDCSPAAKQRTIKVLVENAAQDSHISQEHYGERSLGVASGEGRDVTDSLRGTL